MPDLAAILARDAGVRWFVGTVSGINSGTVEVAYGDGKIPNVGYLDGYVPSVGDTVHILALPSMGCLILGSNNYTATLEPPVLPVPPPVIVSPTQWGSCNDTTATWTGGVVTQGPVDYGEWYYSAGAFASLDGYELAAFEIEVVLDTGGPPEFFAHQNTTAAGPLLLYDTRRHAPGQVAAGVATWAPLPLDWALGMISGAVAGIGIGGGVYTGNYTGTGRLRITSL